MAGRGKIDALTPLPPDETAAPLAADGRDEKPRRLREAFGGRRMAWTQLSTPLDPLPFVWGFSNLMTALGSTHPTSCATAPRGPWPSNGAGWPPDGPSASNSSSSRNAPPTRCRATRTTGCSCP